MKIVIKNIIKEALSEKKDKYSPSFPYNSLITKKVWDVFIKEVNRVYNINNKRLENYNPEKVSKLTPEQINSGYCHTMAWAINKVDKRFKVVDTSDYQSDLRKAGVKYASDHGFVVKDGIFYDAESPKGVDHPSKLLYFKRFMNRKKK